MPQVAEVGETGGPVRQNPAGESPVEGRSFPKIGARPDENGGQEGGDPPCAEVTSSTVRQGGIPPSPKTGRR